MKNASAALKAFLPGARELVAVDLFTITPGIGFPVDLVSDTFDRANVNPIGSPWSAMGSFTAAQILSNALSPHGTSGVVDAMRHTGITWPNDQFVQFSLAQMKTGAGYLAAILRSDSTFANGYYVNYDASPGFGGIGLSTPINIQKFVSGVAQGPPFHALGYFVPQIGDVFRAQIVGGAISVFVNGNLIGTFTDPSPIASGSGGLFLQTAAGISAASDLSMDDFVGGNANAIFPIFLTSSDQDVFWKDTLYSSQEPHVSRGKIKWGIGTTVDKMELTLAIGPAALYQGVPMLQAIAQGAFDGARFQLDRLFGSSFGSWVDSVTLFSGNIADLAELTRTKAKFEVRSRLELLNQPLPRNIFMPSCRWTLYDAGCTLSKSSFGVNSSAQSGSGALLVNCGLAQATGHFDLGTVTFTSGKNNGVTRTVKKYTNGSPSVLALIVPLPYVPEIGDTFTAFPGCDKLQATCLNKFNNLANFGGQPYVPLPETAI